ncbi:hypothetical protein [Oceanobacillus halophilus]|uniref:Uncharacterized protein n=1 Tax=Oceanobacillus halophilus TaxID=930130 RepID=A0A495A386_9BACI|nr:hypothetical protein [Oceanobacillus halophilus]RKQ33975.1 hypothetical protein D8M06_09135 [Oceanobacillus halophilus]
MNPHIIRIGLIVISWLTAIFLSKQTFRKYLPLSIFSSLLVICFCFISHKYKWWKVRGGIAELTFMDLSFILGPFFVGTMWAFRASPHNFKRYLLINLFANFMFSYPLTAFFEKHNVYKLVNFKRIHLFVFYYLISITVYGYHYLIEKSNSFVNSFR